MTLDEAIKHEEGIAEENQRVVDTGVVFSDVTIDMLYCDDTEVIEEHLADYQTCADEHRQVAEWLKELKAYKENTCEDAISREAAVNAIYDLCGENVSLKENPWRDNPHMDAVVDALENLPSVTPQPIECEERKSGNCPFYAN